MVIFTGETGFINIKRKSLLYGGLFYIYLFRFEQICIKDRLNCWSLFVFQYSVYAGVGVRVGVKLKIT